MILDNIRYFPELSHIEEIQGVCLYVMSHLRYGILFEIPGIDLENQTANEVYHALNQLLKVLPEDYEIKIQNSSKASNDFSLGTFRSDAIQEIGYLERKLLLAIERKASDPLGLRNISSIFRKDFRKGKTIQKLEYQDFYRSLPWNELQALGAKPLTLQDVEEALAMPESSVLKEKQWIDFGSEVLGVIRLYRQGVYPIQRETLAQFLASLPLPYRLVVSAKKISKTKADFYLRSLINRQSLVTDVTTGEKVQQTEETLKATALQGNSLLELEWLLLLPRKSEESLRKDLESALSTLQSFGEVMIESHGGVNSYLASRFGNSQHYTFLELDSIASNYLPVAFFGEVHSNQISSKVYPRRSLILHREDGTLHTFDLFNPHFLVSNAIICGKSGSGKSVFGNLLSSSLLQDPLITLTKIDVGGSYRKECETFGGKMIDLNLNHPSGINPFRPLKGLSESNEAVATLCEFICTLVKEEKETAIPKMMQASVESNVKLFCEKVRSVSAPTIDLFLKSVDDFPRKPLLQRWAKGGVYENALKESDSHLVQFNSRYLYFNFENIQGAANPDFATGIMAAVIAQVNLKMLEISLNKTSAERFVLFCDETKFFVERNSDFFLLTTANFRKFGHSVVLMAQNIQDFDIKRPGGEIDHGIILNSPIRVFFETHLSEDYLRREFQFCDREIETVLHSPYRGADYREAILQDDLGIRKIRTYLTPNELWRVTSRKEHILKYEKLRSLVPELTAQEAIQFLALGKMG